MSAIKWSLGLAVLCMLVGSASASVTELLFQEGHNVVTYSVNNTTAAIKKLGSLPTKYADGSASINRSGSFLYLLGFSASGGEYFSVYALTSAGVPKAKPVQTLIVKPALTQFYIHPNGMYAYAMFSWTEQEPDGNTGYASDIVLFTINPKTGKLTNTTRNIANFPLNEQGSTSIDYMNSKGTELYTVDRFVGYCHTCVGPSYASYAINAKTGLLGPGMVFWSDISSPSTYLGDSIFAYNEYTLDVYSMGPDPTLLVQCDVTMLMVCADDISPIYIHPSDKFLFLVDQSTNEVPILYISLPLAKLEPSGASIPGSPSTVFFSPDGLLVYAIEGSDILVYVFNPHSGLLTARTMINAPGLGAILPVQ
jgi:hypothetical protein